MDVRIDGLEALVREVVREEVAAALGGARESDPWLDSAAAAEYIGCSRATLHDYISSGALPRVGGRKTKILLRRSTLDSFIESRGRS